MKTTPVKNLDVKLVKRKLLELSRLKKELELEKNKSLGYLINCIKPKSENDLLKIEDIVSEYKISRKTIDRMRAKRNGLKYSQKSPKGTVWILRKDFENYLMKDRHGR